MDTNGQALDGFERWFYGGAPPEGDAAWEADVRVETMPDCVCTRSAHALLARLRKSMFVPVPVTAA